VTDAVRIGVFGGTFDPPHAGHLVAAVNVAHQLELDLVLFVVAGVPWQKVSTRFISPPADRLAMVDLALSDRPGLASSAIEVQGDGDSVTADTLEALRLLYPAAEFVLIVGSDAAAGMNTWRRAEDLKSLARVAVVDRPGSAGGRPPQGFVHDVVACPLMDISSSDIRDRSAAGLPVDFLVPDAVRDYVATQNLYARDGR
jgi:nicotinate-nucleotide adenylyltransferase